jgi:hypothetical protein
MAIGDRSWLELSSLNHIDASLNHIDASLNHIDASSNHIDASLKHTDASSNRTNVHIVSDSDGVQAKKLGDEQYSHGLKLVLLAGASIVAVFLIALD